MAAPNPFPAIAADENRMELIIDHLCGEGLWTLAPTQASDIPIPILERVKQAAERAFLSMQPFGPLPPYSKIMQGPNEPHVPIVERLTRAIELQIRKEHA